MKEGWKIRTLGEICTVDWGNTNLTKSAYVDDGKYLAVSAAGCDGRIGHKEHEKHTPVLSAIGAQCGRMFLPEEDFTAIKNTITLTPRDGMCISKFLYQLLTYVDLPKRGAAQPFISKGDIQTFKVPVPPLAEQQRIVGILDRAFEAIATAKANTEKNRQSARAIFESHLQSIFTQRGKEWIEKRLGDICERVSVGHVGPTSEFYCDPSIGIPFVRSQNVRPGKLDWDGVQYITKEFHERLRKSQLRRGDLLFVRVGANRGDCCAVLEQVGALNCANIVFARPTNGNAAYLARYCQSPPGRAQLLRMTTGAAQGVINTLSVAELVVPLPSLLEQLTIVNKLNELDGETERLTNLYHQKLAALEALKTSLLHQAFSGDL